MIDSLHDESSEDRPAFLTTVDQTLKPGGNSDSRSNLEAQDLASVLFVASFLSS